MASKAIRRRPAEKERERHMETTMPESVTAPLLGNSAQGNKSEGYEPIPDFWDGKSRECLHWVHIVSTFITQSARKIVNAISEFGSFLARFFGCSCAPQSSQNAQTMLIHLSPLQEERLKFLRQRLNVPFDCSAVKHQDALKELWRLAYPNRELPPLKSDLWKEMGWQNSDPATDFRSGGFMSLENLIYFARNYPVCFCSSWALTLLINPLLVGISIWLNAEYLLNMQDSFHRLLHKADGERAEWEYPFAVAGVNISYMLVQMLDLQSENRRSSKARVGFAQLLEDDEMAFDNLFCLAFQMLDAQWLARRASYMEFNEVLKSTLGQLEQELTIGGVSSVQNLPSFRMLRR
ncbi:ELMO domain-containing protein C isoform X1 [Triticum aestivum]|nr:ELMO domain-containing protein C-like isoform X1 [Triticum aestivum]XP_044364106.1 ELMO domain-containing protein C-like isoform X1 [Triticum aestivum]